MRKQLLQILFLFCLFPIAQSVYGQTTLFSFGSSWKYLDNGSNQGTAWTGTGFSDAAWTTGSGYFGYGDSWITNCVNACGTVSCSPSCGTKYITTYFRKVVNIPSTSVFDSIKLSLYRDDGMVVYVNGVEVWRDNLPTGTIINTTLAPVAIGGADESTPIVKTIPISFFSNGNNTIAVELHQNAGTSSDLTFNMEMVGIPSLTLFDYGAAWKFLDNGSDQGTGWTATGFSDAAWASDTGYFGYADPWINRCVNACGTVSCSPSCTNKYVTTYFRKLVSIPNPSIYDSIKFFAKRDDGIVVYVNGTEVWRDNMPTGTISYTTLSPTAINAPAETTAVVKAIPISFFTTGNNTIAVEVHQQSGTSSDLTFNMKMTAVKSIPVVPVTLAQGPYLQMGNQTAVSVRWRTNIASKSRVAVGTVLGTYPIVVNDATALTEHELRITGLTPDTKYFYRFGTDTNFIQGDSTNFFVTAPSDTSTRQVTLAAFGDCGRNDNSFQTGSLSAYQNYLASQNKKAADLMLLIGDNAYNDGTDVEFSSNFFSRYSSNILKNHMLFPAPGNHDYANSSARQIDHNVPYYNLFSLPSGGECGGVPSGTEAYYSYNWGNVHVLSLDSYGQEDAGTTRLYDTTGAQVTWIKNDLAANTKKWTIAYWHHPPYTMGSHNSDGEGELINIRQRFIKILERNGVDMIICGHSHDYERSYLLKGHYGNEASFSKAAHTADSSSAKYNGTTNSCPYTVPSGRVEHGTVYVVTGSSGADGGVQSGYPHNALPFAIDDGGMFYIDIKNNRLDAKFLRRDNTIGDQFTIMKDVKVKDTVTVFPGAVVSLNATWLGGYAWSGGATTRAITVTATTDTLITVKDSLTRTCLTDQHYIDVVCTTPVFTSCPSNMVVSGCNNTVTYTVADTATPNPSLTHSFSGATTGSGTGTGSGSVFNTGVTTVTITATNDCGSVNCSFTITVNPLPATVAVTGGGAYCVTGAVSADNGADGTIYYQGTTSGGTSVADAATIQTITTSGVYYFRALGADGCWGAEGSANVTINSLPNVYAVTGGGAYCSGDAGVAVAMSNSTIGVAYQLYHEGTILGSPAFGTNAVLDFGLQTIGGVYKVVATDTATSCESPMSDSATVVVNPLPMVHTVTGGGSYCTGSTGVHVGLDNADLGFRYQLWTGTTPVSSAVDGEGTTIDFGVFTAPGTYKVIATDTITGCQATMQDSAVIVAHPLPVAYAVTGGGAYCATGTGVAVGLANAATGISYQLLLDGTAVGAPIEGSGTALTFGLHTTTGDYSVVAIDIATSCTSTMTGSVTVSINPLPAIYTVTGGGAYCAGGTGVLTGLSSSDAGISYQLYNGTTAIGSPLNGTGSALDFGNQTAAGTYGVIANNDATHCESTMTGAATVSINPLPTVYTTTGGGSYCAGGSGVAVALSNSNAGIAYQLFKDGISVGSSLAGTGVALNFGLQTAAGVYTVAATNIATSCVRNMAGSPVVNINALPTLFSVTGGGNYCAGGSGVRIGLGGSTVGINYQLYNGSSPVGAVTAGSGIPLNFGLQTAAGRYTVMATNATTACINNMPDTAVIAVTPVVTPVVTINTVSSVVCTGDTLSLTATGANVGTIHVYDWTVNGVYRSSGSAYRYVPANGDIIKVRLTSSAVCRTTDTAIAVLTQAVTSRKMPLANINVVPGNLVCDGSVVTFVATPTNGGTAPTYTWLKNTLVAGSGATYRYAPTDGDEVILSMNSNLPCRLANTVYSNTIKMEVSKRYLPVVEITAKYPSIIGPGKTDTLTAVVTGGGPEPTFKWVINGNVVPGATTATLIYSNFSNGDSVSCIVTGTGTCSYTTFNTIIIHVGNVGVNTVNKSGSFMLTPNPNNGSFTINGTLASGISEAATLEVTDMLGRKIYNQQLMVTNGRINERIDLNSELANGMYLFNLHTAGENVQLHFVVGK